MGSPASFDLQISQTITIGRGNQGNVCFVLWSANQLLTTPGCQWNISRASHIVDMAQGSISLGTWFAGAEEQISMYRFLTNLLTPQFNDVAISLGAIRI